MKRVRVAIDACLSERLVGALDALYGHQGFEFLYVNRLAPAGTDDPDWASVFGRWGGRIVISGNHKIGSTPHQAVAFLDNGFASFFPSRQWQKYRGHERTAVVVHQWPAIRRVAEETPGGSCWWLPCDGEPGNVRLCSKPMKQMIMPDEVLHAARTKIAV